MKAKRNDRTEKSNLTRYILFAADDTASSHQLRRLGVVEERSSVVAWPVVSAVSTLGNVPEVVWLSLWAVPCPIHDVVVCPKCVWVVLLGWSMWKVDHDRFGGGLLSAIVSSIHSTRSGRSPLCCCSIVPSGPFCPSSPWPCSLTSAVVDQKFPFGERCHPIFLMPKRVPVVADLVQVDSICPLGCMFWNYSKFLRKQLGDWHVGVQFGHVGAVAVVEMIENPWQDYGRSAEYVNRFRINSEKATAIKNRPTATKQNRTKQKQVSSGFSA